MRLKTFDLRSRLKRSTWMNQSFIALKIDMAWYHALVTWESCRLMQLHMKPVGCVLHEMLLGAQLPSSCLYHILPSETLTKWRETQALVAALQRITLAKRSAARVSLRRLHACSHLLACPLSQPIWELIPTSVDQTMVCLRKLCCFLPLTHII